MSYLIMSDYNPRFTAYAKANGKTELEMMEHDTEKYPGGKMTGFIIWMDARWAQFNTETGSDNFTQDKHEKFDAWLKNFVDKTS